MAYISFDNGKHLLTAAEAKDKLAKKKMWEKVTTLLDGDIMMEVVNMPDIPRDMTNVDNRVIFIDRYLSKSTCDLVVF